MRTPTSGMGRARDAKVAECADWDGTAGRFNCKARDGRKGRDAGEESGTLKHACPSGFSAVR